MSDNALNKIIVEADTLQKELEILKSAHTLKQAGAE